MFKREITELESGLKILLYEVVKYVVEMVEY